MGEYARAIRARVGDGIASHGTLRAYIHDFRASFKLFEMVVAELMTRKHGRPFRLWEDIALDVKDERGLPHPDTGIDVTDATTTIVQCKLRTKALTWHDCATFLACALGRTDGEDGATSAFCVPWQNIVVARNACSRVTRHYAFYASKLKFDTPISLDDVESELLMLAAVATTETVANNARIEHMELRDFQLEAIDLCVRETSRAAYIVLPTGCGKSLIMAHVAARVDGRTLILVPFISLLDQTRKVLSTIGIAATAVGGAYVYNSAEVESARVVICVYNSAHKVLRAGATKFKRVLFDEAHTVPKMAPWIYSDLLDAEADEADEADELDEAEADEADEADELDEADETDELDETDETDIIKGYAAARAATMLSSARLFSATLDVPEGAEQCTGTLGAMIHARYICDYRLNVPVFDVGATISDLARHLVRSYRSMLIFCSTCAEGLAFCAVMNETGPCARYVDCDTSRLEMSETLDAFKSGVLAFLVNVRVLSVGFDAPITKGVCFVNMPASKTHIVQVIGRCLRLHPDKRCAQVVLPLVAGTDGEDTRARDFMRVLAQNDERFAQALRDHRGAPYVSVHRAERGGITASETEEDESESESTARDVLYTAVYDTMGAALVSAWDTRYAEMIAFYDANGRMPKYSAGLGAWKVTQSRARATMLSDRRLKLDALPYWKWSVPNDEAWAARYDEMVALGRLPKKGVDGALGVWAHTQRMRADRMIPERKLLLAALPFWKWRKTHEVARAVHLAELAASHAANGRIAQKSADWLRRQLKSLDTMDPKRKEKLDALPFLKRC